MTITSLDVATWYVMQGHEPVRIWHDPQNPKAWCYDFEVTDGKQYELRESMRESEVQRFLNARQALKNRSKFEAR